MKLQVYSKFFFFLVPRGRLGWVGGCPHNSFFAILQGHIAKDSPQDFFAILQGKSPEKTPLSRRPFDKTPTMIMLNYYNIIRIKHLPVIFCGETRRGLAWLALRMRTLLKKIVGMYVFLLFLLVQKNVSPCSPTKNQTF